MVRRQRRGSHFLLAELEILSAWRRNTLQLTHSYTDDSVLLRNDPAFFLNAAGLQRKAQLALERLQAWQAQPDAIPVKS